MTAPDPFCVTLTERDLHTAKQAASFRSLFARATGVGNQQRDDRSGESLDYLGLRAEIAVAKIFNADYDPNSRGIDNGVDMWIGGVGIDVKATFHQNGRLLFKSLDAFRARIAILATAGAAENVVNVIGCISKETFAKKCSEFDVGKGIGYAVEQNDLEPLNALWDFTTRKSLKGE